MITDETLASLADASQSLAREISKASRSSSAHRSVSKTSATSSARSPKPYEPISLFALPSALLTAPRSSSGRAPAPPKVAASSPLPAPAATARPLPPPVTKKPSKWKLSFGKNSALGAGTGRASPAEEVYPPPSSIHGSASPSMSTTASNVSSLIMGLNAPSVAPPPPSNNGEETMSWTRGRRNRAPISSNQSLVLGSLDHSIERWGYIERRSDRAISPNSTRSGRPVASSASSVVSSNWRSSVSTTSSAGTSTSAFTRYSNSSTRSVSTAATSVSSASWRTNPKPAHNSGYAALPKNIKIMNGVPWELDQLPRGQHPNPVGDIFGSPPVRKQRTRKPKDVKLDTINERPAAAGKVVESVRRDASTSTTDLDGLAGGKDEVDGVKKVQKGQINALAKMLSALRR